MKKIYTVESFNGPFHLIEGVYLKKANAKKKLKEQQKLYPDLCVEIVEREVEDAE